MFSGLGVLLLPVYDQFPNQTGTNLPDHSVYHGNHHLLVAEPVINTFLPYSLAVRVLIAVLLLAPLSFCMGMPFLGVSVAEQYSMRN